MRLDSVQRFPFPGLTRNIPLVSERERRIFEAQSDIKALQVELESDPNDYMLRDQIISLELEISKLRFLPDHLFVSIEPEFAAE